MWCLGYNKHENSNRYDVASVNDISQIPEIKGTVFYIYFFFSLLNFFARKKYTINRRRIYSLGEYYRNFSIPPNPI